KEKYDWTSIGSGVEITYENLVLGGGLSASALTWGYRFDGNGNVQYAYYPAAPSVAESPVGTLPSSGTVYDLSTATNRYYVLEYAYSSLGGDWKIDTVKEWYSTTKPPSVTGTSKVILDLDYALSDGGS